MIPSENVRTVLQTQLRSGEGPDVFGYDTGPGFAGALAKAGLVYDLTAAYQENDWPIYDFAKQRVTFDGKLVGVPSQIEEVGVFYNKDIFTELGIEQPQSSTTSRRRWRRSRAPVSSRWSSATRRAGRAATCSASRCPARSDRRRWTS